MLISKGVPPERIVTMMFDDLADNPSNPYPGSLYNHPDMAQDVYAGLVIDYAGNDVTADNFYAVLTGNTSAVKGGNGKVIGSTGAEHIFVFYSDHGGPGILCAPTGARVPGALRCHLLTPARRRPLHLRRRSEQRAGRHEQG